jgi:phosphoribosylformylglycinamidine cyclo-ligase
VGVDITEISKIHKSIETILSGTFQFRKGKFGQVLGVREHYAGLIEISKDYALALHVDGVGTKVLVAEALHKYDTIGIDCVAMNVNDVICLGAEPVALVNYLALEKPRLRLVADVMRGLRRGAREADIAVVSGETAIMPDVVNGFDLAAAVIGVVRKDKVITGEHAEAGDVVLGLRGNGIHSNGLTLARKTLLREKPRSVILRELLRPTRIYVKAISKLLSSGVKVHGLAHITGGAYSKLRRIGLRAKVGFQLNSFPDPPWIFKSIQKKGHVSDREMFRTFNMGIGFLIICPQVAAKRVRRLLPEIREVGYVTKDQTVRVSLNNRNVNIESY